MCCKNFWNKILVFYLTFGIGFFVVKVFVSSEFKEETNYQKQQESEQMFISAENELKQIKDQTCVPIETVLGEPFKNVNLGQTYVELIRERTGINTWLKQNSKSSKSEKAKHKEKLKIIEKQIEDFNRSLNNNYTINQTLLDPKKCYIF